MIEHECECGANPNRDQTTAEILASDAILHYVNICDGLERAQSRFEHDEDSGKITRISDDEQDLRFFTEPDRVEQMERLIRGDSVTIQLGHPRFTCNRCEPKSEYLPPIVGCEGARQIPGLRGGDSLVGERMLKHIRRHDLHDVLQESVKWRGDKGRQVALDEAARLARERNEARKRRGHEEGAVGVRRGEEGFGEAWAQNERRKREAGIFNTRRQKRDEPKKIKTPAGEKLTIACIFPYIQRNGVRVMYRRAAAETVKTQKNFCVKDRGEDWERTIRDAEEWAKANLDENCAYHGEGEGEEVEGEG